jgi:hypothetical protein
MDGSFAPAPRPDWDAGAEPAAEELAATFDAVSEETIGVEEEFMVLNPATLKLAPLSPPLLELIDENPCVKREFATSMIETITPVCATFDQLEYEVRRLRGNLAASWPVPALTRWRRPRPR